MMIARRRTQLLILLLIVSAIASAMSSSLLSTRRERAFASQHDLAVCQRELAVMDVHSSGDQSTLATADAPINRQLRAAAIAAHLSDQLVSIDPGVAARVGDSDYMKIPLFVRLNAVTLRQLVGFLHELSSSDSTLRSSDIELSPALVAAPNRSEPGEPWTADLTISYLTLVPQHASAH